MGTIEPSENKIIMYFENEVGTGMLPSNIQQNYNLQISDNSCLLNAGVEHSKFDFVFKPACLCIV